MTPRSKIPCLLLAVFVGVFFLSSHTYGAEPQEIGKIVWLAHQIADYLELLTDKTYGQSFRDMTAQILIKDRERAEEALWYQDLDTAYKRCEAARQEPDNEELQWMCELGSDVAIQQALEVLAASEELPPESVSVFKMALEVALGEAEPPGLAPELEAEREVDIERLVLDPQTSEQEHYYEEGREVSPSQ